MDCVGEGEGSTDESTTAVLTAGCKDGVSSTVKEDTTSTSVEITVKEDTTSISVEITSCEDEDSTTAEENSTSELVRGCDDATEVGAVSEVIAGCDDDKSSTTAEEAELIVGSITDDVGSTEIEDTSEVTAGSDVVSNITEEGTMSVDCEGESSGEVKTISELPTV